MVQKNLFSLGIMLVFSSRLFGVDCAYWEHHSRQGSSVSHFSGDVVNDTAGGFWHDEIDSVWIRQGHAAKLCEHHGFQGTCITLYGNGSSSPHYDNLGVHFDDDGVWYNLHDISFGNKADSFRCY